MAETMPEQTPVAVAAVVASCRLVGCRPAMAAGWLLVYLLSSAEARSLACLRGHCRLPIPCRFRPERPATAVCLVHAAILASVTVPALPMPAYQALAHRLRSERRLE